NNYDDLEQCHRILIHIGDAPLYGRRFSNFYDRYPNGGSNGLTAE
ncbi:29320_t:CDS:1, partial [Racocetra persica]